MIIGIDPGQNASAAFMGLMSREFIDIVDLKTVADGENRQIDVNHLASLLEKYEPDHAVIENVQPMPSIPDKFTGQRRSMGAASAFRFGLACGMIRGVIRAFDIPVTMVTPQSWQRHFELKGSDKKPHIEAIKKLYPSSVRFITRQMDHGRADAGLIVAWYVERREML